MEIEQQQQQQQEEQEQVLEEEELVTSFWTEATLADAAEHLQERIHDAVDSNVLCLAQPNFVNELVEELTTSLYEEWMDMEVVDELEIDDLRLWVSEQMQLYFTSGINVPPRSKPVTLDNNDNGNNNTMSEVDAKLTRLQQVAAQLPLQRSPEWYAFRSNRLTASNLYKALGTPAQINSLIYEKCVGKLPQVEEQQGEDEEQQGEGEEEDEVEEKKAPRACAWGETYELVSRLLYEHLFCTTVAEFGCIPHPTIPFLAASPDGVNVDPTSNRYGRLVEIKNVVNRVMTVEPSTAHWVQCQATMETLDLDACDLVETKFVELDSFESWSAHTGDKGILLHFVARQGFDEVTGQLVSEQKGSKHVCMPFTLPRTELDVHQWTNHVVDAERQQGWVLLRPLFWYLDALRITAIDRNRRWFAEALPRLTALWDTVLQERVTGYDHRAPKKRSFATATTGTTGTSLFTMLVHKTECMDVA